MKAARELPDGSVLIHEYEEMTPEKRPQDPARDGSGLRFEVGEGGYEGCPEVVVVTDDQGRSCTFVMNDPGSIGPQSHDPDGKDLRFEVLEYGGDYDDDMPKLIRVTDLQGQSALYAPITEDGRVVDSKGFRLLRQDA